MRTALVLGVLLTPAPLSAQSLCPLLPLEPPLDRFAGDLSVDGARLAATVEDGPLVRTVALMERVGPAWRPLDARLPMVAGELFGYALDLEGSSLLASAPFAGGHGSQGGQGLVRHFHEAPAGWIQGPPVTTDHPRAQFFGQVLDRDGAWLAVQSWWTNLLTIEGRVHLFRRNLATTWPTFDEVQVLEDPLPLPASGFSGFGRALGVSGTTLVVGSPREPEGRAYVWQIGTAGATFLQELTPSSAVSDRFGSTVAVDGERIVVGDPGAPQLGGQGGTGAVHVFERLPGATTFTATSIVRGPAHLAWESFGSSVDLVGARLAATFSVPTVPALPPGEGLAVIDDLGLAGQSARYVVQSPLGPVEPVGRLARLADGEVVTTNRTLYVGTGTSPAPDLGRFALDGVGGLVCDGAPNSTGNGASLELLGCGGAAPLYGSAARLPSTTFAVPVLGTGAAALPVGQGTLCIASPMRLGVVATTVTGTAVFALSPALAAFPAGAVVRAQLWYRDGAASNLTDALELEVVH